MDWRRIKERQKASRQDVCDAYARAATTNAERIERTLAIERLALTVREVAAPRRRELFDALDEQEKLARLLAAVPMALPEGMDVFEKALDALESPYDVRSARFTGPVVSRGEGGAEERLVIAVGETAYVLPSWSTVWKPVTFEDGFVSFVWRPTRQGTINEVNANDHTYAVVFAPDGTVEEFRVTSASGPVLRVVDGKMFSVRPYHWNDPEVKTTEVKDEVIAVWGGLEGPRFARVSYVLGTGDGPVYVGCKKPRTSTAHPINAIVRHPDEVWFEGERNVWCNFSKTPDARPVSSTVYAVGPRALSLADGSVVWAVADGEKRVAVHRNREPVLCADVIAFHKDDEGVVTAIERTKGDGRRCHVL